MGAALLTVVFAIVSAWLANLASPRTAVDQTLSGPVFGVALPLLVCFAMGQLTEHEGFARATYSMGRYGASRRRVALGLILLAVLIGAFSGSLLGGLAVALTRSLDEPAGLLDLATTAWIGALGGAAYGTLFALGTALDARGRGRLVLLVADWLLGSGVSVVAVPWPRGHLQNLLGATPVLGMPQWSATLVLAILGTVYAALALWRLPP